MHACTRSFFNKAVTKPCIETFWFQNSTDRCALCCIDLILILYIISIVKSQRRDVWSYSSTSQLVAIYALHTLLSPAYRFLATFLFYSLETPREVISSSHTNRADDDIYKACLCSKKFMNSVLDIPASYSQFYVDQLAALQTL